jgi:transcription factor TFIIIB component B''
VTILTTIDKSGSNKRIALKVPPRRRVGNLSEQNVGSQVGDTASHSQSLPGTPDPQAAQDIATVNTSAQQERSHHEDGSSSIARTDGKYGNTTLPEMPIQSPAISGPILASSRTSKAPTVISTIPQKQISSNRTGAPTTVQNSEEAGRTGESAQTSRQTRTSTRSLRLTKNKEPETGTTPSSNDETSFALNTAPRVSATRCKATPKVQGAATHGLPSAEPCGDSHDAAIQQVAASESNIQAPAKMDDRSEVWASSAGDDGVPTMQPAHEGPGMQPANLASATSRSARKRKPTRSAQEAADEAIAEAIVGVNGKRERLSGRKGKRKVISEETENHEIAPANVKMADLIKDQGLGKGSKTEAEMQKIDWVEVKRRRREAEEEALRDGQRHMQSRQNGRFLPAPGPHAAERLVLVNGQMVIDESSRVIDRNAATAKDADHSGEAISEDRLTKRVNQATVGRKMATRRAYSTWDDEETEQFYQGLRLFGTDFMMISKMFPGTSRAIIKKKYTKEEKLNSERVITALNSKEAVDLQSFSEMTDTVYEDPKDFYKELEDEQARMEAEDARLRAKETEAEQEIQESIEQEEEREGIEGEHAEGGPSRSRNRFAVEAQRIVDGAASRKKKSKKTPSAKKKAARKGKGLPAEGTEEIIGSIENYEP